MVVLLLCSFYTFIQCSLYFQDSTFLTKRRVILFRIDASFSDEEQRIIGQAIKRWQRATNNYVEFGYYTEHIPFDEIFRWKSDGVPTIYNARSFFSWERHIGKDAVDLAKPLGVTVPYTGDIFLLCEGEIFSNVITHEVGHVLLRFWHSKNEMSIMYPYITDGKMYITVEEQMLIRQRVVF
jgi:hypothetical protein